MTKLAESASQVWHRRPPRHAPSLTGQLCPAQPWPSTPNPCAPGCFWGTFPDSQVLRRCLVALWPWGLEGSRGLGVPCTKPQTSSPTTPRPRQLGVRGSPRWDTVGTRGCFPMGRPQPGALLNGGSSPRMTSADRGKAILRASSQAPALSRSVCFENQALYL